MSHLLYVLSTYVLGTVHRHEAAPSLRVCKCIVSFLEQGELSPALARRQSKAPKPGTFQRHVESLVSGWLAELM